MSATTDTLGDLLTRIRNAQSAGLETVSIPASGIKIAVTHILKEEGFLKNYKCIRDRKQGILKIALKYDEDGAGAIIGIHRTSTPSRRLYVGATNLPKIKNGLGVAIISTPKGIMTDRDARKAHVGGEYLCSVF